MNKESIVSKLINDIVSTNLYDNDKVVVAELLSNAKKGIVSRDTNTALVSHNLVSRIRASNINIPAKFSGVSHYPSPYFWIYLSPSSGLNKAETLVASWISGNHTSFCPNQNFLAEFGLSPRMTSETIYWDDLSRPNYNVVENKPFSYYSFPNYSQAFVKVDKDYLFSYLLRRDKIAVHIFREVREIQLSEEILFLLGTNGHYIHDSKHNEVRITKFGHRQDIVRLEVCGYKVLFEEESEDSNDDESEHGHYWKGIKGLVNRISLMGAFKLQYAYVSDNVLCRYEEDDSYEVYPESGSVHYGIHWSVSHCERVGKNAIRVDLKKLYEGNRNDVISYWNKFSIDPKSIELEEENIVEKAIKLTRKYLLFGRLLSNLINEVFLLDISPAQIITLDEKGIKYYGITQHPNVKPITNVVTPDSFSKEQFISRCKKLNILLVENIQEKTLRKIIDSLGFLPKETKELRSLKLLSLLLKYLYTASNSGLDPINDKEEIIQRCSSFEEFNIVAELNALNTIRQLDAHNNGEGSQLKFNKSLKILGIERNSITNNYAKACEEVYNSLNEMFININNFLSSR